MPAWLTRARRRGEPEARTNLGRPIIVQVRVGARVARVGGETKTLLETVGDTPLGQIVWSHFDQHLVAGEDTDAVLAHATGGVSDDLVVVLELDPEGGVREQFRYDTRKFQLCFLRHRCPSLDAGPLYDCRARLRAEVGDGRGR